MTDAIAGIDIGGTKIGIMLGTADEKVLLERVIPTQIKLGPYKILECVIETIEEMKSQSSTRLVAVGIGCGGPLDLERGLVMSPPNLPGWDEFPIVELVGEKLRVPVRLENDANAAALGEYVYGAGRGFENIVYVTISTGIGGGIIIMGKVLRGLASGTGEIGHLTVIPNGPLCGCGAHGCLEAVCSGTAIARRARELLAERQPSIIEQMVGDPSQITSQVISAAAAGGDELACRIWDEMVFFLSIGIGNVITLLAPEAVIIGGGVASSGEQLLGPLRSLIRQNVKILPIERVQILQAYLGNKSGAYGALIIGREVLAGT
jgi:glucokinase